jgi:hypothetical protein
MPDLTAFKKPDGTIDWDGYHAASEKETDARIERGEVCYRCRRLTVIGLPKAQGYRQKCYDCRMLEEPKELSHPYEVRCPKCGYHWKVGDSDDYELYEDGEHEVSCAECNTDFTVTTYVSYSFVSPARNNSRG